MNVVGTVSVEISVVLGKAVMPIHQLLRMGRGAVIELVTEENDEVYILANNIPVAKGSVMVQGDKIAVTITQTISPALDQDPEPEPGSEPESEPELDEDEEEAA